MTRKSAKCLSFKQEWEEPHPLRRIKHKDKWFPVHSQTVFGFTTLLTTQPSSQELRTLQESLGSPGVKVTFSGKANSYNLSQNTPSLNCRFSSHTELREVLKSYHQEVGVPRELETLSSVALPTLRPWGKPALLFQRWKLTMDSELPHSPLFFAVASRECHNIVPPCTDLTKHLLFQNRIYIGIYINVLPTDPIFKSSLNLIFKLFSLFEKKKQKPALSIKSTLPGTFLLKKNGA